VEVIRLVGPVPVRNSARTRPFRSRRRERPVRRTVRNRRPRPRNSMGIGRAPRTSSGCSFAMSAARPPFEPTRIPGPRASKAGFFFPRWASQKASVVEKTSSVTAGGQIGLARLPLRAPPPVGPSPSIQTRTLPPGGQKRKGSVRHSGAFPVRRLKSFDPVSTIIGLSMPEGDPWHQSRDIWNPHPTFLSCSLVVRHVTPWSETLRAQCLKDCTVPSSNETRETRCSYAVWGAEAA
jgi:hypothetical protein